MAPLLFGRFTFPVPFGRFMVPALPGLPVVDSDLPVFGLPPIVELLGLFSMLVVCPALSSPRHPFIVSRSLSLADS